MTAIDKVKEKLWQYKFKVADMTEHKFIQQYDLVVEGIYRVAVRKLPITELDPSVDVLAVIEKKQIIFYKAPWLINKKLLAEMVDTSPLNIFIKHEQKKHKRSNSKRRGGVLR